MHLAVYRDTDARSIVHTHSPYAAVLSTLITELPAVHYMIATLGGPVRVSPYRCYGTKELAQSVSPAITDRSAVIIGNHGGLTIGSSVESAYARSITLEWLCALYYRAALLGNPRILTEEELEEVQSRMEIQGYGAPQLDEAEEG